MPGPAPKESIRRQRRNEPKQQIAVARHEWLEPPGPRRGWLQAVKLEWEALWSDPLHKVFAPTDVPELLRLFDLKDERERIARAIRRGVDVEGPDGNVKRVSAMLVPGSTGNMILNPLLRQRDALDERILALTDRFGLNLKARLGLGIDLSKLSKTLDALNSRFDDDVDPDERADDPERTTDPRAALALVQLPGAHPGREAAS